MQIRNFVFIPKFKVDGALAGCWHQIYSATYRAECFVL